MPVRHGGRSGSPVPLPDPAAPTPCQTAADRDLWFAERSVDVERAKELCHQCPVRKACLVSALERREPWGVWGGEVFVNGVVVARKRGRGRPRKDEKHTMTR
ncbi:WhiB family transcriptional regulator [Georgenia sp. H159]|uniref:WhiB family transcriptional regulator n=1 Tax=Georgenia sp. H159 TaxID=3076115 RepID=UPI002D787F9C|nr:WhiB family transcriptional regulator [Georgenia sp. H159]